MKTLIRRLLGRAEQVWVVRCSDCAWRATYHDDDEAQSAAIAHAFHEGHFVQNVYEWQ
jgi:hypothetical protein